MKLLSILLIFSVFIHTASAQIDLQCNGRDQHSIYFLNGYSNFYRIDSVDTHPSAPVLLPQLHNYWSGNSYPSGLSINKNFDDSIGGTTFYTAGSTFGFVNYFYNYWNDSVWTMTNHQATYFGHSNLGGTDSYVFNLIADTAVYRYDGTNDDSIPLILLPANSKLVEDVATDREGNFYLFFINKNRIISYNPNGIPIDSFSVTGSSITDGEGFAILGSALYVTSGPDSIESIYKGTVASHAVNFSLIDTFHNVYIDDIATCTDAADPLAVFKIPSAPHFIIYPNPAIDKAIIKLDNTNAIDIFDCMGRKIFSTDTRGLTQYELPIAGWTRGVYFVTATSPNGLAARTTLVVQ